MGLYVNYSPAKVAAAAVVFPVVGAILIALRYVGRSLRGVQWRADDWLVLPALLFLTGMGITNIFGIAKKAIGYTAIPESDALFRDRYSIANAVFWNTEWLQVLALGSLKLSLLFFYRRVFVVNNKACGMFNLITTSTIVLTIIWTVGFFLAVMLTCPGHVSAFWASGPGRTEPSPTRAQYCWPTGKFLYAYCWSDVAMDVIIFLLPIQPVMKLQLPFRRKLAVMCVFFLGIVTLAISIVRAAMYVEFLNIRDSSSYDDNMLNTNGTYWMLVETGLAMIVVNLPPLYAFVRHESVGAVLKQVRSFVSIRSSISGASKRTASSNQSSRSAEKELQPTAMEKERSIPTNNIVVTREFSLTSSA